MTGGEQIDELYRYSYGAILMLTLEERVGEGWVTNYCKPPSNIGETTDYAFFATIAKVRIITVAQ